MLFLPYGSWNQKFLDYEIETSIRKITDTNGDPSWNQKFLDYEIWNDIVSFLYRDDYYSWNQKFLDYEIETWRTNISVSVSESKLESKVSRLRDWNSTQIVLPVTSVFSWNQKFLDYEIETNIYIRLKVGHLNRVGIKSFSITRLKQGAETASNSVSYSRIVGIKSFSITRLKHEVSRLKTRWIRSQVGIKSFSITRLKPISFCDIDTIISILSWNQKFLDYEIETRFMSLLTVAITKLESKVSRLRDWNQVHEDAQHQRDRLCWNQKFLDYEIETCYGWRQYNILHGVGIKSFSITRLKHQDIWHE